MLTLSCASLFTRLAGRRLLRVGLFTLALAGGPVQASVVAVVLSDDAAPYHEASDAIEAALKPQHSIVKVLADKLAASGPVVARASLLVTVGVKATEQIAGQGGSTAVLAVLVTEDWYQSQGRAKLTAGGRNAGAVVLEQPLSRQFRLVRNAFPKASRVGVVVGRKNADALGMLQAAAEAENLALIGAVAESESALVGTLGQVLKDADLLLVKPRAINLGFW